MSLIRSRKLQTQIVAILIIVVFFAVGAQLLASKNQDQTLEGKIILKPDNQLETPEDPPSITTSKFNRKSFRKGKTSWELNGEKAEFYDDKELAKISSPKFDLDSNTENQVTITSKFALVSFKESEINQADLNDNVLLVSNDMKLKTDYAQYFKSKNQLVAPNKVEVISKQAVIYGKKMKADLATEVIKFQEDVDSVIESLEKETSEQSEEENEDRERIQKVLVKSDQLNYYNQTSEFEYQGNVTANHEDYIIYSDQLKGNFDEVGELDKLQATGNVRIIQGTTLSTRSEKADFDLDNNTIILTGNPELEREKNLVLADIIYYNTVTKESHAEGEVQVKMLDS